MSFLDSFANTYDTLAGPELAALALGSGLLAGGYTFAHRHTPSTDRDQAVMPVMTPKRIRKYMESLDREGVEEVPKDIQAAADEALQQIEEGETPDLNKAANAVLDYIKKPENMGEVMGFAAALSSVPLGIYGGKEIAERMMLNEEGKDLQMARRDFNRAMLEEQLAAIESGRHGELRPVKSGAEGEEEEGRGLLEWAANAPGLLVLGSLLAGGAGGYAYHSANHSSHGKYNELKRRIENRMAERAQMAHQFHPDDIPDYSRETIKDFSEYLKSRPDSRA